MGDKIVSNGKGSERRKRNLVFYLCCSQSIMNSHSKLNTETGQILQMQYWLCSHINNQWNNCQNGESLPCKTSTSLATNPRR